MKIQTTYKVRANWKGASLDIEVWREDESIVCIRIPFLSLEPFFLKIEDADDFHEALKRAILEKLK